jgi:hypothetical protein
MQRLATIAAAVTLAACSAAGPTTDEIMSRRVADGYGRLYVLREKRTVYSLVPVTISVDDRTVGTLRNGTYLATDLPAGAHTLTAAALVSRASTRFALEPGETLYADIEMQASGLPPPRGAIGGAPASPITTEPGLFSIRFLDERAATAALAGLSRSD